MIIEKIFEEMKMRAEVCEYKANQTIEGNTDDNKYVYSEEDREALKAEQDILEKTMELMDNLMDEHNSRAGRRYFVK